MFKKILLWASIVSIWIFSVSAYTNSDVKTANFLADKSIVVDKSSSPIDYRLDDTITRREMLKIMMKLSGKTVEDICDNSFGDMNASDWGCKYAEAALDNSYIAANANFRPADNISKIESLKMIMQAKGIARFDNTDWRVGYTQKAEDQDLISYAFSDYDTAAKRSWIFTIAGNTFSDFNIVKDKSDLINGEEVIEWEYEEIEEFFLGL